MVKIINMEDEGHAAVASKCGLWWLTFLIERFKDCGNLGILGHKHPGQLMYFFQSNLLRSRILSALFATLATKNPTG